MITETLAPATLPPDQRIYAVGDIHGCDDQLAELHAAIAADLAARPVAHALVIHLGDCLDRGPDCAGVIARLMAPLPVADGVTPPRMRALLGNHEDMLLQTLASGDPRAAAQWLQNGGGETLASWGLSWRDRPAEWAVGIPPAQLGFLRALPVMLRAGGYVFVHAGIHPARGLAEQRREDLLWIRDAFLNFDGALPAVVVHGHTPEAAPTVRVHRIGVDTGAVLGGSLTAAVLQADRLGFLQVR